ncbi:MAG: nucleotide-binding protein [Acidobacteriota bacterium]|nr:nucleotide-binding protein [Acidobacteriota bacterium]
MFIASSTEAHTLANVIAVSLEPYYEVRPWRAGIFKPSHRPVDDLQHALNATDYAVFVFSKDDKLILRRKRVMATRDNVIFELGIFIGHLGSERCFVLVPRNRTNLRLPSDLEGYSPIEYDATQAKNDPEAAVFSACMRVRLAIDRMERLRKKGA